MSILEQIAGEGMREFLIPESQDALSKQLHEHLNAEDRRLLRRLQDAGETAGDDITLENYYRGFCAGMWFAETFLQANGRL